MSLRFIDKIIRVFFIVLSLSGMSQNIDRVVAVVGKNIILKSEVEIQLQEMVANGMQKSAESKCKVFEDLLFQKLLLAQADKDSVSVKDEQVDTELERRMAYYINQFGSEERFESFYGKTVDKFKEELRDEVKNQLIIQQMQSKVTGEIKVTPAEVRNFFNSIPVDSLPLINSEIELGQIVKKPMVSEEAKKIAWEKLETIRQRVLKGESMAALATLYTEDPGSAKTGGRYDGIMRGQFVPEFEAVAFRIKPGDVSEIFETQFGYHFIELIARRGESVDVRHILMVAKTSNADIIKAKQELDSIYESIISGRISFCEAAAKYSDEKETKNNCGSMMNVAAGSTKFDVTEVGQIDQNLVFLLDKMNVGDITKPTLFQSQDTKQAYRIVYLKSRSEPHTANLKDDYQRLQGLATIDKQKKIVAAWITKKSKSTYIKIDEEFVNCNFDYNWIK